MANSTNDINPFLQKILRIIEERRNEYIETLREAVAIPSVSAEPELRPEVVRMVHWTAQRLTALGAQVEIKDNPSNDAVPLPPIIFASLGSDPSKKTVLIYGHLDVQPAKVSDGWNTDPWELVEKDGKMFGRGSTDDKGPVLGWLHAIAAYQQAQVPIPLNIKFVLEAMEESGSEGLEAMLHKSLDFLKNVDCVCISDNYWIGREHPCLTYGLRGLTYFFLEIECGSKDLHSGVFGGSVREAMPDLMYLLNSLTDSEGNILIPGILDHVLPLSPSEEEIYSQIEFNSQEFLTDSGAHQLRHNGEKSKVLMSRWRYPSLSIHGIEGCFSDPGAKTVIPRKVIGKFSIRLVPNQKVEHTVDIVTKYINDMWALRGSTNKMKIYSGHGGNPWIADTNHANYRAASKATKLVYGKEPFLTREGGSIPITLIFQEITNKNVLLLPMGASDDGAHSQNEKLDIRNYIEGTKLMAAYLMELGNSKESF